MTKMPLAHHVIMSVKLAFFYDAPWRRPSAIAYADIIVF